LIEIVVDKFDLRIRLLIETMYRWINLHSTYLRRVHKPFFDDLRYLATHNGIAVLVPALATHGPILLLWRQRNSAEKNVIGIENGGETCALLARARPIFFG
jgi:hypothetical protein